MTWGSQWRRPQICMLCVCVRVKCNNYFEQGTAERLTMHLVEEHSVVDPTYIEDFLLTYRTFLSSPMVVGKKLLEWFHDPSLRDKVHWRSDTIMMGSAVVAVTVTPQQKGSWVKSTSGLLLLCVLPIPAWLLYRHHSVLTSSRSLKSSRVGRLETPNCPLIWAGEWIVCVPCNWLKACPYLPASRSVTNEMDSVRLQLTGNKWW